MLIVSVQSSGALADAGLRDSLEALSKQSTVLEISDILLHRNGRHYIESYPKTSGEDSPAYVAWLGRIAALNGDKEGLLKLLNDPDAKIRTLSMAALASRDDITVLPAIAALVYDMAPTYSGLHQLNEGVPERERKVDDQMVCEVAQHIIGFYLDQGSDPGCNVAEVTRKTEEYVEKVQQRPYCAVTFLLAITRSLDYDPDSKAYADAKAKIRLNLAKVPNPDRAWISLWLDQKCPYYNLYSQDELIAMFKDLGPDEIMLFLEGKKKAGTDPDAQDADIFFFLKFADRLLRPADADALISKGNTPIAYPITDLQGKVTEGKSWPDAHWLIAAAKLQPNRAAAILRSAFDRYASIETPKGPTITFYIGTPSKYTKGDTKAELCVALWQMCGESQASFIADRFYNTSYGYREDPTQGDLNRGWRCDFIDQMAKVKEPPSRKMIAYLLEDKRVETYSLNFQILRTLANYTLELTGKDMMTDSLDQYFEWSPNGNNGPVAVEKLKFLRQIHDVLKAN